MVKSHEKGKKKIVLRPFKVSMQLPFVRVSASLFHLIDLQQKLPSAPSILFSAPPVLSWIITKCLPTPYCPHRMPTHIAALNSNDFNKRQLNFWPKKIICLIDILSLS